MLNEVVLHGELAERFGGPYMIEAPSIRDAVRNLCGNFPELKRILREGSWIIKRVFKGQVINCDESMLMFEMRDSPIHLFPAVSGSGAHSQSGQGTEKMILGAVLIAAAVIAFPYAVGAWGAMGASAMTSVGMMGIGLMLGGLAMLISPGPSLNFSSTVGSTAGVTTEGQAVPLVFGVFMATGTAVANQAITNQVQVGNNNYRWTDQGGTNPIYIGGHTSSYVPLYSA